VIMSDYEAYVREMIERGLADVRAGRVVSQEEAEARINEWLASLRQRPNPHEEDPSDR
jgi:predicted transcriptional regulator